MGVGTLSAIGPCVAQVCVVRRRRCHDYGQPTPIWINQSWKEGRTKKRREPGGGRPLCGRPTHPPDNSSQPGGESGKSQGGGKRARAVVHQKERLLLFFFFCLKTAFFTWAPRVSCKVLCTRLRGQLRVSPIPGVVVFRCALLQFLISLGSYYIAVVISWILYII